MIEVKNSRQGVAVIKLLRLQRALDEFTISLECSFNFVNIVLLEGVIRKIESKKDYFLQLGESIMELRGPFWVHQYRTIGVEEFVYQHILVKFKMVESLFQNTPQNLELSTFNKQE